jgi:hypothetical protein
MSHQSSAPDRSSSFRSLTCAAALGVAVASVSPALAFFQVPLTTDLVTEVEGIPNLAKNYYASPASVGYYSTGWNSTALRTGRTVASQALSNLSQTTTQEPSRTTINKMSERRGTEEQRCAEGFTRVDGECRRISPPAPEAKKVVEAKTAQEPSHKLKKAKKPKAADLQRHSIHGSWIGFSTTTHDAHAEDCLQQNPPC